MTSEAPNLSPTTSRTKIWNYTLSSISILNILFLVVYFFNEKKMSNYNLFLFILVINYTLAGAFRSIRPVVEGERTCLFHSNISVPLVTRSVATIAELSYITLLVLVFNGIIKKIMKLHPKNKILPILLIINLSLIALNALAQFSCWVGTITTDRIWNAVEESIWAGSGIVILAIALYLFCLVSGNTRDKSIAMIKSFLPVVIVISIVYIAFMILVDVPMYIEKAKNEKNIKKRDVETGIKELKSCSVVTQKIEFWRREIPWLSGYFTFGVWSSIALFMWNKRFLKLG